MVHQRPADYVERRADGWVQALKGTRRAPTHPPLLTLCHCWRMLGGGHAHLRRIAAPLHAGGRQHTHTPRYLEPGLVFMVGTAHVSAKSAADVQRVVQAVQPECVVVELCRSRTALLAGDPGTGSQSEQQGRQQKQDAAAARVGDAAADGSYEEQQQQLKQRDVSGAGDDAPPMLGGSGVQGAAAATAAQPLNPLGLSGSSTFLEALGRTLSQGGQSGLVLRLLLARQARRAAGGAGGRGGGDDASKGLQGATCTELLDSVAAPQPLAHLAIDFMGPQTAWVSSRGRSLLRRQPPPMRVAPSWCWATAPWRSRCSALGTRWAGGSAPRCWGTWRAPPWHRCRRS